MSHDKENVGGMSLIDYGDAKLNGARIEAAKKLGLPENATWKEIDAVQLEKDRKELVAIMNLPLDTPLEEIRKIQEISAHNQKVDEHRF